MSSRIIRSNGGSKLLLDNLSSLLISESINPSEEIYIISPWITNYPLINNENNKCSSIFPFAESNQIYLADIIETWAWKGSKVRIICDPNNKWTQGFIDLLDNKVGNIEYKILEDNHEKGFVTDNFYIHGSMNFTYSGIFINGERIRITSNRSEISEVLISIKARWKDAEKV
ncbi:MAG: phospholipase D-like domain-containing protein DpdK [Halanaerobiales bacterium]